MRGFTVHILVEKLGCDRGAFHSFEKAYEILSQQKDSYGFLVDFLENKRIFAKGVRDFLGVKCPSDVILDVSCRIS